jgi:hypothetical protein
MLAKMNLRFSDSSLLIFGYGKIKSCSMLPANRLLLKLGLLGVGGIGWLRVSSIDKVLFKK